MTSPRLLRVTAAAVTAAVCVLLVGAAAPTEADPTKPPKDDDKKASQDWVRDAEYWIDGAGFSDAWKKTKGKGTVIAIIDTGIGTPPDVFDGAVIDGTDVSGSGSSDGRTPVGPIDSDHGTWVASLAASRGNPDGTGVIGVAPEASLLAVSLGIGASAAVPFIDQVPKGIKWAVDHGADVINLSFTTNTLDWDESWDDAFLYAYEHDVVVVAAAGNRGTGTEVVGAPATIPGVLTVGGVDQHGEASWEASTQGITIGVSAPSEGLVGVSPNGEVVQWPGTSGAAPIVAGAVALVRAAHPDLDAANVINRIVQTAKPAEDADSHPDPIYGYGLLDAEAAVNDTVAHVDENPMGDLKEWIRVHRRAESEPAPEPDVQPTALPPLPPADAPTAASSPLIPSAESLRYGTLPLLAITVPGILIGLGVTAAARHIRSARGSRAPDTP